MIDPRVLQQHFKKVHQKEQPLKQDVPRVPDLAPLTAVQAIFVPSEPVDLIEQEIPITDFEKTAELSQEKETVNLVINVPPSIGKIVINDFEEEVEDNPYGYTNSKQQVEDYDPYGYYPGPKF